MKTTSKTIATPKQVNRFTKFTRAIGVPNATLLSVKEDVARLSVPSIAEARLALKKRGLKPRVNTEEKIVYRVPQCGRIVLRKDKGVMIVRNIH